MESNELIKRVDKLIKVNEQIKDYLKILVEKQGYNQ